MRRVLAILFVLLLPLQFSWAAVAVYCGHETADAQAQHLGHHEHQHAAGGVADADQNAAGDKAVGAVDADCGHCHGCCAGMPVPAAAVSVGVGDAHARDAMNEATPAWASSPPERPQWASLA